MWYVALASRELRPGALVERTILGQPLVLGRRPDGAVFGLRNICPHRAMPLHHGMLEDDGGTVRCGFHGWTFDTGSGRCTAIPALVPGQGFDASKICVHQYPCREAQGNVWVFIPRDGAGDATIPPPPVISGAGDLEPRLAFTVRVRTNREQIVLGLVDPAHLNYVHRNRWWKPQARPQKVKEKHFEPTALGFRMARHPMPAISSRLFRTLGHDVTNEITFELPGTRVDHFEGDRHRIVICFTVTPVDDYYCDIHHRLYFTNPALLALVPVARAVARRFIAEDVDAAARQAGGLQYDPPAIFIPGADTQIRWYYRLVRAWAEAAAAGRPFENPLEPATLRWRS
jgi:phenylpropionate dioxygenase-like ring-hydroxylating dioxygenase large terminal subunit